MKKCALCLQKAKLCDSHIVPEALLLMLDDNRENPENLVVSGVDGTVALLPHPKRVYDKELLCEKCEEKFNRFETYFRDNVIKKIPELFFQDWSFDEPTSRYRISFRREPVKFIRNLDYKSTKLFLLSMLWRLGITKSIHYNRLQLTPAELEELRSMLNIGDPGEPMAYPCHIQRLAHNGEPFRVVFQSKRFFVDGEPFERFAIGELLFTFSMAPHEMHRAACSAFSVSRAGLLPIVEADVLTLDFCAPFSSSSGTRMGPLRSTTTAGLDRY